MLNAHQPKDKMSRLQRLYYEEETADVTITCKGWPWEFKVHLPIICQMDFFRTAFLGPFSERFTKKADLVDDDGYAVMHMLRHLYEHHYEPHDPPEHPIVDCVKAYNLATKYMLPKLKRETVKFAKKKLRSIGEQLTALNYDVDLRERPRQSRSLPRFLDHDENPDSIDSDWLLLNSKYRQKVKGKRSLLVDNLSLALIEAYEGTIEDDRWMRDAFSGFGRFHQTALFPQEKSDAARNLTIACPEFMYDLVRSDGTAEARPLEESLQKCRVSSSRKGDRREWR